MLKKSIIMAVFAAMASVGAAQAAETGGKLGGGYVHADSDGVKSHGIELDTATSMKFDNGVVLQSEFGIGLRDMEGASSGEVTSKLRAGYHLGNGLTFGGYIGRSYMEVAGDSSAINGWGLEGKYAASNYEVEAGLGRGTFDVGTPNKLDLETAYLGGRYGLNTAFGEVGLGGSANWLRDREVGVDFKTATYLAKVDYMAADNLEIYAGVGKVENSVNGYKADGNIVKIGAEYKFGKGQFWRTSPF